MNIKCLTDVLKVIQIEFPNVVTPAPYILRPFAGIYNPFPYGCSILCNHPADYEAKDVVRKAKDSWASFSYIFMQKYTIIYLCYDQKLV